jgi:hypothetical protein
MVTGINEIPTNMIKTLKREHALAKPYFVTAIPPSIGPTKSPRDRAAFNEAEAIFEHLY